jgi:hypothetical protein
MDDSYLNLDPTTETLASVRHIWTALSKTPVFGDVPVNVTCRKSPSALTRRNQKKMEGTTSLLHEDSRQLTALEIC